MRLQKKEAVADNFFYKFSFHHIITCNNALEKGENAKQSDGYAHIYCLFHTSPYIFQPKTDPNFCGFKLFMVNKRQCGRGGGVALVAIKYS